MLACDIILHGVSIAINQSQSLRLSELATYTSEQILLILERLVWNYPFGVIGIYEK